MSVQKTPFWENLEILAFTALIFAHFLAFKPPNLEIFSVHKPLNLESFSPQAPNLEIFSSQAPSLSEANISSQTPHFGNPGRTPLPEKKLILPPPSGSFGHPNVRAVISLSSNYCARKGVIKDHRTVFFFSSSFFYRITVKKNGDNAMLMSHIVKNKPQTGLFSEISSNLGWKHDVPEFVWMNFKK